MNEIGGYADWQGNGEELAKTAGDILAARGLADDPISLNVRLIRDYAQRGIISRSERRGKEAIFGFRHLLEFVAARVLVADGWPLAKVSEHFAHISDLELIALIPGEAKNNPALSVARRLLDEAQARHPRQRQAELSMFRDADRPSTAFFGDRAARLSGMQAELRESMRRLGLPPDAPPAEQVTLIAIAPWCQLLIESGRLSRLTVDEAEEIGRAITASLLNPEIRKGRK